MPDDTDTHSNSSPGSLVDIGGTQLYLCSMGEGGPAVVLEAGLSDTHAIWTAVREQVAAFTHVCSYDRAGLGQSAAGQPPRTASQMTGELHTLLHMAAVPGPYILVGHSFGGLIVQLFAARYPDEVAGLVLVDSAHEEQEAWLAAELSADEMAQQLHFQNGSNAEGADLTTSFAEMRAERWQLQVPVMVLVRGTMPPDEEPPNWSPERAGRMEPRWRQLQSELAARSPQGRLIVAEKSGHYIHHRQPELVVQAIRDIVAAGR